MNKNNDSKKIDRLCDFLVEDILSATDEEILQEALEDYSDPDKIVASVQASIGKARLAAALKELSENKKSRTCDGSPRASVFENFDAAQLRRIVEMLAVKNGDLKFSLAARKGKDLTAQDIRSLLEDLQELGCNLDEFIKGTHE